jgi:hypothetical protein
MSESSTNEAEETLFLRRRMNPFGCHRVNRS